MSFAVGPWAYKGPTRTQASQKNQRGPFSALSNETLPEALSRNFEDPDSDLSQSAELINTRNMHLSVEMGRAVALMFNTGANCHAATEHTSSRTHVATEFVLTPTTIHIAMRTERAHAKPQNCCKTHTNLQPETLNDCKRILGCGHTS